MLGKANNKQLTLIESLLKTAIANQEKMMTALDDLKKTAADLATDAGHWHDEVTAALDHILKVSGNDMEVAAVVDSLKASHSNMVNDLKTLKDKVDSVAASGGPAK